MIGRNIIEICTGEALRVFTEAYPTLGKAISLKAEAYGDTIKITFETPTDQLPILNEESIHETL